ncbi:4Fe-4S dicluster domain-containing protein [Gluconobacter thailandicus]|nr:ferredoxin family protein [Gluconobacter thailandicus]
MSGIETTGNRERAMNTPKCLEDDRTGLVIPVVDFNRCEGKDACVAVCPYDVFEVRKIDPSDYRDLSFVGKIKSRIHGGMVAYTPHADQCRACGLCVKACPERAIKLVKI